MTPRSSQVFTIGEYTTPPHPCRTGSTRAPTDSVILSLMTMTRDQIAQRIAQVALLRGEFTLRSGRKSDYYLDKYRFSTEPDILRELGRLLAERVPPDTTRLAGAELGGVPLVAAASLATDLPCVLIRNQRKDYGTANQIEGRLEPGDRVVLIEDVCTSGGQVLEAAKAIEGAGGRVVKIVGTIDREEGARQSIQRAGYPFESLFTRTDLGV